MSNTPSMSPPNVETSPPNSLLGSFLLIRANEGRTLHAFGHTVVVLLDGKQTGEKFTAFLNISPPASGSGRITTNAKTKWFISVEGRVSFLINGTWTDMFPGDCAYSPAARSTLSKIIRISLSACSECRSRGI